jgi:hypothetical protein
MRSSNPKLQPAQPSQMTERLETTLLDRLAPEENVRGR